MIVVGLVLLIIGFVAKIAIVWSIGVIMLVVGLIFMLLGHWATPSGADDRMR